MMASESNTSDSEPSFYRSAAYKSGLDHGKTNRDYSVMVSMSTSRDATYTRSTFSSQCLRDDNGIEIRKIFRDDSLD